MGVPSLVTIGQTRAEQWPIFGDSYHANLYEQLFGVTQDPISSTSGHPMVTKLGTPIMSVLLSCFESFSGGQTNPGPNHSRYLTDNGKSMETVFGER